jgi:high-affinity nickel-transport protein
LRELLAAREGWRLLLPLLAFNIAICCVAFVVFRGTPVLLGLAVLAYSLGLRHAFDIDHIAAIDNVTRKLTGAGRPASSVGLFFSIGHSTIVFFLTVLVGFAAKSAQAEFALLRPVGDYFGTAVSSLFLAAIALANLGILIWQRLRGDNASADASFLSWPFRFVDRGWHMYVVGMLFGLGFDTATEIGLLSISATSAAGGLPVWSVLLFPMLFAAAMSLVDTLDSTLMRRAYGWAFRDPGRRRFYDIGVTGISAAIALAVSVFGIVRLAGDWVGLPNILVLSRAVGERSSVLGMTVVFLLLFAWFGAAIAFRLFGLAKAGY